MRPDGPQLYCETIPKLWDMPDEEAQALMRQWTGFEPGMPDVVTVRCEFVSQRNLDDRWGAPVPRHQEIPACYFTRNFSVVKSYLGNGKWRQESQPPGPPWGKATPPRKAMALFNETGQGIAVFSPAATEHWNFGPHGDGDSDDPTAGPCMHVAPIGVAALGHKSVYRYRYWLVVGTEAQLAARLDALWEKYSTESAELTNSTAAHAPGKPKVILIRADDLGGSDLGCYGSEIMTPQLDRLAANGLRFTQFYNSGKCEPTRASLMSGQYWQDCGLGVKRGITMGQAMGAAGYATLAVGKWHLDGNPVERGLDRYLGHRNVLERLYAALIRWGPGNGGSGDASPRPDSGRTPGHGSRIS